jgi:hypothetical protein
VEVGWMSLCEKTPAAEKRRMAHLVFLMCSSSCKCHLVEATDCAKQKYTCTHALRIATAITVVSSGYTSSVLACCTAFE